MSKCRRCHRNPVSRRGQICATCKSRTRHDYQTATPQGLRAQRVLDRARLPGANGDYYSATIVTTHAVLRAVGQDPLAVAPETFIVAADLAALWTRWMNAYTPEHA